MTLQGTPSIGSQNWHFTPSTETILGILPFFGCSFQGFRGLVTREFSTAYFVWIVAGGDWRFRGVAWFSESEVKRAVRGFINPRRLQLCYVVLKWF